jgi:hypothetical protein
VESVETWEWIAIGAVGAAGVILLLALAASVITVRRRRSRLQKRFGPEYFRAVSSGSKRRAERRLANVEDEHKELHIRGLPWVALERYLEEWRQAEARFVSDPADATRAAERVVTRVLEERGYPIDENAEEIAAHIGADYPDVANRYRHGRTMLEASNGNGRTTEDLRRAMVDFRAVLEELLVREPVPMEKKVAGAA